MDRPMVVQLSEVVWKNLDDHWFGAFGKLYMFTCTDACTETTKVYLLSEDTGRVESCVREALGWDIRLEAGSGAYRFDDGDYAVIEVLRGPKLRLSRGQRAELRGSTNLARIAYALRCIQTEGYTGMGGNFVTFSARPGGSCTVQFCTVGQQVLYVDTLGHGDRAPEVTRELYTPLETAGWSQDEPDRAHWKYIRSRSDRDRFEIALGVRDIFVDIYGIDFTPPLDVNLHLQPEWRP
jgi:hypothetical protein